jgi:hypothetical protein
LKIRGQENSGAYVEIAPKCEVGPVWYSVALANPETALQLLNVEERPFMAA